MKIGIFSDTHLPPTEDPRFSDSIATLERMVQGMIERKVDLVLFGGDVSTAEDGKPQVQVVEAFGRALERFAKVDYTHYSVPIVMIPGNTDLPRLGERSALSALRWIPNITVSHKPEVLTPGKASCTHSEQIAQIITLPYFDSGLRFSQEETDKDLHDQQVGTLHALAAKLDRTVPSILLAHCSLAEAQVGSESQYMAGQDMCLSIKDIPDNINWCFFGHLHKPQEKVPAGVNLPFMPGGGAFEIITGNLIHIIGSTECVDSSEEGEQKRWILLDTEAGTVESIPTGAQKA